MATEHDIVLGRKLERSPKQIGFLNQDQQESSHDVLAHGQEGHLLTIAPTGAGKGVGALIPTLLDTERPVIVIDPKAENLFVTWRRRAQMGHTIKTLDPFEIGPQELRVSLNPLSLLQSKSPGFVDEVQSLVELVCDSPSRGEEAFWVSRARHLLLGLIIHLVRQPESRNPSLADVKRLVSVSQQELTELGQKLLRSGNLDVKHAGAILTSEAPTTIGGILAFAQNALGFLAGPQVQKATDRTTFDPALIRSGNKVSLYILIPPEKLMSHGKLLRIWLGCLFSLIMSRQTRPAESTLLLIDEAAQLGRMNHLVQAMTLLRGYGLQVWPFFQDLSQLTSLYPEWVTLVNNASVLQVMGAQRPAAAQELCALISGTSPLDFESLAYGQGVVSIRNRDTFFVENPNYLTWEQYRGKFAPNPYFSGGGEFELGL